MNQSYHFIAFIISALLLTSCKDEPTSITERINVPPGVAEEDASKRSVEEALKLDSFLKDLAELDKAYGTAPLTFEGGAVTSSDGSREDADFAKSIIATNNLEIQEGAKILVFRGKTTNRLLIQRFNRHGEYADTYTVITDRDSNKMIKGVLGLSSDPLL